MDKLSYKDMQYISVFVKGLIVFLVLAGVFLGIKEAQAATYYQHGYYDFDQYIDGYITETPTDWRIYHWSNLSNSFSNYTEDCQEIVDDFEDEINKFDVRYTRHNYVDEERITETAKRDAIIEKYNSRIDKCVDRYGKEDNTVITSYEVDETLAEEELRQQLIQLIHILLQRIAELHV